MPRHFPTAGYRDVRWRTWRTRLGGLANGRGASDVMCSGAGSELAVNLDSEV